MRIVQSVLVLALVGLLCTPYPTACWAEDDDDTISVWDPIEPVNRGIFWFNDHLDTYIFEPIARKYVKYVPEGVRIGLRNVTENLKTPVYAVAALLQLDPETAAEQMGAFVLNSTMGLGGFFDPASELGFDRESNDSGITFGYYGVPPGPYLVLPFLGPSSLRDALGMAIDSPIDVALAVDHESTSAVVAGSEVALGALTARARLLDAVDSAKETSVDLYLAAQSAQFQSRRGDVREALEYRSSRRAERRAMAKEPESAQGAKNPRNSAAPFVATYREEN